MKRKGSDLEWLEELVGFSLDGSPDEQLCGGLQGKGFLGCTVQTLIELAMPDLDGAMFEILLGVLTSFHRSKSEVLRQKSMVAVQLHHLLAQKTSKTSKGMPNNCRWNMCSNHEHPTTA